MKRALLFLMMAVIVFPMLSGCAKELNDQEMFAKLGDEKILARASEIISERQTPPVQTGAVSSPSAEPLPTPTPETKPLAPVDLLGEKFNPFYNVAFPEGYTPYAAKFDTGNPGEKPTYSLYLTAEGDTAQIVKYVSQLAGITDESSIASCVNNANKNGCVIDGTADGKGMKILCNIKKTQKGAGNYEQCDDVNGCRVDLIALVDKESIPQYRAVFTDNYTFKIFGSFADNFAGSIVPDRFTVTVNPQKPKFVLVSGVHQVSDAAALIKNMSTSLKYDWYDEKGNAIGLSYGRISCGVKAENNTIIVDQTLNDAGTAAVSYIKPDVSLSTLGFGYFEKDALCIYENGGYRIALHKPEWGERKDKWNIEFFYSTNGYNLIIWYIESEKRYTVQVDKGSSAAKYEYFAAENRYDEGYPDKETVQRLFKKVFGDSGEYLYNEAIDKFNEYFSSTFGMTVEKLYALPLK